MVWSSRLRPGEDTFKQKLKILFFETETIKFYVILRKYCQSLSLNNISLCFLRNNATDY